MPEPPARSATEAIGSIPPAAPVDGVGPRRLPPRGRGPDRRGRVLHPRGPLARPRRRNHGDLLIVMLVAPVIWVFVFHSFHLYGVRHLSPQEEFRRLISATALAVVLITVGTVWWGRGPRSGCAGCHVGDHARLGAERSSPRSMAYPGTEAVGTSGIEDADRGHER